MRTVDIIVTGLFSPVSVAAVGLADLYGQVPLRIGLGLGSGAIALSSQDTGREAAITRDRAIAQALIIGLVTGIPLVLVGILFGEYLIGILGAESAVVREGGQYLALIFLAAPMRIVGIVGANAFQGTGDTRTPMLVNGGASLLNIGLTVTLGLGLWFIPTLHIIGVGLATAISRTVEAIALVLAFYSSRTAPSIAWPKSLTITRQIISVSVPKFAEGMSSSLANFPFNALILLFGTEANAAYHIAKRLYQQINAPIYRAFSTVASIITGQHLGERSPNKAQNAANAMLALGVITLGLSGVVLFITADWFVQIFTTDPETAIFAVEFTRVFAVSMPLMGIFYPLTGVLQGAGDTRTPFYARFVGTFGVLLGVSYLLGIQLEYGLMGVYLGIFLSYVSWAGIVTAGFVWGDWKEHAESMLSEREESEYGTDG